jgi:hypothetical protein
MKSPFPGMDPYLEAHWGDVHSRLAVYACDQIQRQLPKGLKARVEEYLTVQTNERRDRAIAPDVRVVERPQAPWDTGGGVAVEVEIETETAAEPKLLPMPLDEPITLRSIRIIDTQSGNRVVTGIGFLSPANKLNRDGRKQYRQKQKELLRAGVNLVEVDLLRRGRHIVAVPQYMLTAECLTPYRVCAVRAAQPGVAEFYPIALQHRLPMIRIRCERRIPTCC